MVESPATIPAPFWAQFALPLACYTHHLHPAQHLSRLPESLPVLVDAGVWLIQAS